MNYLIIPVFCATLLTTITAIDEGQVKEFITQLKAAGESCNGDPATKMDLETLKSMDFGAPKPEQFVAHIACLTQNLGLTNPDGSLNEEAVRSKLQGLIGDVKANEIISECQGQADIGETAQCIMKHLPIPRMPFH